ncbi:MAG: argininosuccinate synthase, partial [Acidobacteria bacterium]|nr:argininosuccinate synthase [Acidobacteriota bacterium]
MKKLRKVALAYSGGLDTSIIISWLKENYGCDVVAVAVDVGQAEETAGLAQKAYATGACDFHLVDAKEEFAAEYLFPVLRAGAIYERDYLLGTSTARPLIARKQVEIALATGCDALAHGCTGKGNDQVRFEAGLASLAPGLKVLAPVRDSGMTRDKAIEFAAAKGLPIDQSARSPYSIDQNLWGRAVETGYLEDIWNAPQEDLYEYTADPAAAREPDELVLTFTAGVPTAIDGTPLSPLAIVTELNARAGAQGVGRLDMVEDRLVGIKSREIYEAPGAIALITAHSELESVCVERDLARFKRQVEQRWTELVYDGL